MKQETSKKNRKWIWIVAIIALLLVVAGVVAAIFMLPNQQQEGEGVLASGLYWNLDKEFYTQDTETFLTSRTPSEDGLYHIRFVTGGEVVQYATSDSRLVNYIDTLDVMGLVLDADGMLVDAVEAKNVKTEIAKEFFVKKVDGNNITLNSSPAMNGMDLSIVITDATCVMDVRPDSQTPGQPIELEPMDTIWAFGDEEMNVTDLFLSERKPESEVYIRLDNCYLNGETTRVPDENGVYTIPFAVNGKQVELKCKDKELVNKIDEGTDRENSSPHMGLIFDEEGYIIGMMDVAPALRGVLYCDSWNVTAIDGNKVTVLRRMQGSEQGREKTFTLTDDTFICITDIDCHDGFRGQKIDSITTMDRIVCYTDTDNNALFIDVVRRMVDSELYFRSSYAALDPETKEYAGKPDEDGYYKFDFYGNNKFGTYKTKSKKLATKIASLEWSMMGLKLEGSIIKEVYHPDCVSGYTYGGLDLVVSKAMLPIVTLSSGGGFANYSANWILAPEYKTIMATGSPSDDMKKPVVVREGDWVYSMQSPEAELSHVVVYSRYEEGSKIYYNLNGMYNGTTGETDRVPDENGYYVFDMLQNEKTVTVKTKDKKIATFIDHQGFVALRVNSSGVIKSAYSARSAYKYGKSHWETVDNVNWKERTFDTYYWSDGVRYEASTDRKIAEGCKVYNYSDDFEKYKGEPTTLRDNDEVMAIVSAQANEAVVFYVMARHPDWEIYWPVDPQYNPDWDMTSREVDKDGYYNIPLLVNGKIKTFKTKDVVLATEIDKRKIGFALDVKGDLIKRVTPFEYSLRYFGAPYSLWEVTGVKGQKVSLCLTEPGRADEWEKTGDKAELTLAKNCKIYDVSGNSKTFGAVTKVRKGDLIRSYTDRTGKVVMCFVVYRNTRAAGLDSYCEHCDKTVHWVPYRGVVNYVDAHYYLSNDVEIWSQNLVGYIGEPPEGKESFEIVLDLNGHTLTSTNGRNFLVQSALTIMDSAGGGVMEATGGDGLGGCCIMVSGKLDIYGGTIRPVKGSVRSGFGGVISAGNTVINMYGGTIEGGKANNGGNLNLYNTTLNLYGGTIRNGDSLSLGGNMYLYEGSTVNLLGGTVSGGKAMEGGNVYLADDTCAVVVDGTKISGGITADNGSIVTLKGKQTMTDVSVLNNAKLDITNMSKESAITVKADGVFTESGGKGAEFKSCFTVSDGYKAIDVKDGELWTELSIDAKKELGNAVKAAADAMIPAVKAGNVVHDCPMCGAENVTWVKKTDGLGTVTASTHVYYEGTVNFNAYHFARIEESANVCILLADADITTTSFFQVMKGNLNIMGNGKITSDGTMLGDPADSNLGLFFLHGYYPATLNLFGGEYAYTGSSFCPDEGIPLLALINVRFPDNAESCVINIYNDTKIGNETLDRSKEAYNVFLRGTMNMYGGTIRNGVTKYYSHSGNVTVTNKGTLNIYGGTITGGSPMIGQEEGTAGGNIRVNGGKLTMTDGTVSDGHCENGGNGGGNINLNSTAIAKITGGTISGGKNYIESWGLYCPGGNIYLQDAETTLYVGGNAVITGGKASAGGNIGIGAGTVHIQDTAAITNGHADDCGGNIGTKLNANNGEVNLVIDGGTISGGFATTGNNIYLKGDNARGSIANVNMDGMLTVGSEAVVALNGKINMTDVELVTGGKLDITNMSKESTITVKADDVFTVSGGKGGEFKSCFTPVAGYKPIEVKGGELWTQEAPKSDIEIQKTFGTTVKTAADAMIPAVKAGNVVHDCPMCGAKNVTWEKKTDGLGTVTASTHVYYEGTVNFNAYHFARIENSANVCILLADADITTSSFFQVMKGNLNIMGNGKIASNGTMLGDPADSNLGLFFIHGYFPATLNLFGGEYTYTGSSFCPDEGVPLLALINVRYEDGCQDCVINIYNDTKIGNETLDRSRDYYNVFLRGTMNMYGGTIRNGASQYLDHSGNITVTKKGTLNIHGGTITGGDTMIGQDQGVAGGNIRVNGGKLTMTDGTISNGHCENGGNGGGNINLNSGATAKITGGTISGGRNEMSWGYGPGGNILLQDPDVILTVGGNAVITGGKASAGGNICIGAGTVIIEDAATITDGNAEQTGGNIGMKYGSTSQVTLTIKGGTIKDGVSSGGADIYLYGPNAKATISNESFDSYIHADDGPTITLKGKFTMNNVTLYGGSKLNIVDMTKDSAITLKADSVFTESEGKGEEFKSCFTPATGYKAIEVVGGELSTKWNG